MNTCQLCYNYMEVSYSVSGNGVIKGKDYLVQEYFNSLEKAETFYGLVSPVNKVILWELRVIYNCNNCEEIRTELLKTTKKEKEKVKPKYIEKKYPKC